MRSSVNADPEKDWFRCIRGEEGYGRLVLRLSAKELRLETEGEELREWGSLRDVERDMVVGPKRADAEEMEVGRAERWLPEELGPEEGSAIVRAWKSELNQHSACKAGWRLRNGRTGRTGRTGTGGAVLEGCLSLAAAGRMTEGMEWL